MKKVHYIFTLLVIASTLLISCDETKELASSDDIGTYAFNVLTHIENTSEQEFLNSLYTYEELKEYVKNNADEFEKEFIENIAVLSKTNFDSRIKLDYKNLKEKGASFNIDWNAIEAISYQYWPRAKNGVESVKGDLFFTHNTQTYKVTVTAFNAGNSYFITKIEGLKKVVDQK